MIEFFEALFGRRGVVEFVSSLIGAWLLVGMPIAIALLLTGRV